MQGVTLEERQRPVVCRGLPQCTARLLPKPVKRKEEASVPFFLYSSFNEEILSFSHCSVHAAAAILCKLEAASCLCHN